MTADQKRISILERDLTATSQALHRMWVWSQALANQVSALTEMVQSQAMGEFPEPQQRKFGKAH